jgi:hypothetical protein
VTSCGRLIVGWHREARIRSSTDNPTALDPQTAQLDTADHATIAAVHDYEPHSPKSSTAVRSRLMPPCPSSHDDATSRRRAALGRRRNRRCVHTAGVSVTFVSALLILLSPIRSFAASRCSWARAPCATASSPSRAARCSCRRAASSCVAAAHRCASAAGLACSGRVLHGFGRRSVRDLGPALPRMLHSPAALWPVPRVPPHVALRLRRAGQAVCLAASGAQHVEAAGVPCAGPRRRWW